MKKIIFTLFTFGFLSLNANLCLAFTITIKTLVGKVIPVEANASDTILMVKKKVEVKEGIPVKKQRLLYEGKALEDNASLASYQISQNTNMILVIKLEGQEK